VCHPGDALFYSDPQVGCPEENGDLSPEEDDDLSCPDEWDGDYV
jgi:hypothetical protein